MGYSVDTKAKTILEIPLPIGFGVVCFGLVGGFLCEALFGNSFFERFGALTAGLGVFIFGLAASELLVRSQFTFILDRDGEPPEPFRSKTVRFALWVQSAVVLIGTLQWGFGSFLIGRY